MRTLLAACVGALLLTACASAAVPGSVLLAAKTASAAGNKAAALAETDLLVAGVSLPPGAVRVSTQSAGFTGPASGTPRISNLIDTQRYFTVPLSLPQAEAWFERHPQPGFALSASRGGDGSVGSRTSGFGYDLMTTPNWTWENADLEIDLVAARSTVIAIRVDSVAEWIDLTPAKDPSTGPAIRVTIAGGCPASDRNVHDIRNPGSPDLDRQMLPTGAPTAALKCDYYGLNGHAFALKSRTNLNATRAVAAAARLEALPLGSVGVGEHGCPADLALTTIEVFSYPGRADVDIWQSTSGCASTDNGHSASGDF